MPDLSLRPSAPPGRSSCPRGQVVPALAAGLALAACDPAAPPDPCAGADPPAAIAGPPALTGPCDAPPRDPTRLLITTTDFATGAVSVLDLATGHVTPDVALGSADARPFFHDGRAYVLHRFNFDALDILDAADFTLLGQLGLTAPDTPSTNPHALAFAPGGRAYVTLFGAPELQALDLADPAAPRVAAHVDLCPLADADGNPEASLLLRCGDTLFASVERLDRDHKFAPTDDHDNLAAIDRASGRLHDLDPDTPGVQPLALLGPWAKQWRPDPDDPAGRTILVLSGGVERVDLAARTTTWAVDPARLAAQGLADPQLPQAFDLDDAGRAYLAVYTADYAALQILRFDLDQDDPPLVIADGLQSVDQAIEVFGDTLWFGDRTPGRAGMRAWDLTREPPTPRFAGAALPTGLPPYAVIAIP